MTVGQCQDRMSSSEFADWIEYWQLEPFGYESEQLATLLAMFYNCNRKKGAKRAKQEDFMPGKKKEKGRKKAGLLQAWNAQFKDFQDELKKKPKAWREPR